MKKFLAPALCLFFFFSGVSANAQKYKNAADTGKLNLEYVKVSNDIAELIVENTTATDKLTEYQRKVTSGKSDAGDAAISSMDQAAKATNGSVSEAKEAKEKANTAYNEAKDLRDAQKDVEKQEKRIEKINAKLAKKQKRLQQLTDMRNSIFSKL